MTGLVLLRHSDYCGRTRRAPLFFFFLAKGFGWSRRRTDERVEVQSTNLAPPLIGVDWDEALGGPGVALTVTPLSRMEYAWAT